MTPHDAQASLDSVRRFRDRTVDEYVRHGFARPYVLSTALTVFIVFASFDLPNPWDAVAKALAVGLSVLQLLVYRRRAAVRMAPTGLELLYCAAMSVGIIVAYVAFQIAAVLAALRLGLPAHHTVAAAATALLIVATAGLARRGYQAAVRQGVADSREH
jgi:hypothetical protein